MRRLKLVVWTLLPAVLLLAGSELVFRRIGYAARQSKWIQISFGEPGSTAIWQEGSWPFRQRVVIRLNNVGLRGADVEPNADGANVLFIGDSITFGDGVPDGKEFCSLISQAWKRNPPPQVRGRIQVINGGHGGYGIDEETALANELADRFHVTHAILVFCMNDVFEIMRELTPEQYGAYERARVSPLFAVSATAQAATYEFLRYVYTHGKKSRINGLHPLQLEVPEVDAAWNEYFNRVAHLNDVLDEKGIPMAVVVYPDISQVVNGIDVPERRFTAFCNAREIPCVLLLPSFRARRAEGLPLLVPDGHPNALGHRIIADGILGADLDGAGFWSRGARESPVD